MNARYVRSEPGLWTVGYDTPDGKWDPESDYGSAREAAEWAAFLNGGPDPRDKSDAETALAEISDMLDRFDTFGDAGRTRAFVSDLRQIVAKATR